MGRVRLRIVELLRRRGMTPYALAKESAGRISLPMAYRLVRARGRFVTVKATVLEALCDVLSVAAGDLLESEPRRLRGSA